LKVINADLIKGCVGACDSYYNVLSITRYLYNINPTCVYAF